MRKFLLIILFVSILFPFTTFARYHQQIPAFPRPYWGTNPGLLPCGGSYTDPDTGELVQRPSCTSVCQVFVLSQRIIYFGITLVVFAIAPVLLVWGGIMILISAGSPERLGTGKKILTGTIVGIALALGSFLIISTFFWIIGPKVGSPLSNWSSIVCG